MLKISVFPQSSRSIGINSGSIDIQRFTPFRGGVRNRWKSILSGFLAMTISLQQFMVGSLINDFAFFHVEDDVAVYDGVFCFLCFDFMSFQLHFPYTRSIPGI
jgi:hypothetical protein